MTFRGRLRLFFAIIVVVPLVAIGVALWSLVASSEEGKADARIATGLRVATAAYDDGRRQAGTELVRLGRDRPLLAALAADDRAAAAARLRRLVAGGNVVAAVLRPAGGAPIRAGREPAVAFVRGRLRSPTGPGLGTLAVSTTPGAQLAATVARRSGVEFVVTRAGARLGASRRAPAGAVRSGNFDSGGSSYRGRRQSVGRDDGAVVVAAAAIGRDAIDERVADSRLLIAGIVLAFLALALVASLFIARSLQAQVAQFLAAARRLAGRDFDEPVPVVGDDQFAQLGREFNRMSEQVRTQLEEVERRRRQTERTIRRVGTAFASGLDSQAVVELTVQTAVEACSAEMGFGVPAGEEVFTRIARGDEPTQAHLAAIEAAERAVLQAGPDGAAAKQVAVDGVHALAQPLRARLDPGGAAELVGIVTVARRTVPFAAGDTEQLEYLAGQAGISLENAALHQTVQEQAQTDELTGLSNVRQMQRALDRELERGHRFDAPVSFVILDLDDFKQVNDTYGHQQGDQVLVDVSRVLRRLSRDIDDPARYGGEELAVVLAQTDIEGAARAAERMRAGIEALSVPRVDGDGEPLRVTASFGVASVRGGEGDKRSLISAADAALYRAKRAGKNRVEAAQTGARPAA